MLRWKTVAVYATIFLPWPVRRWVLTHLAGYRLHPSSRIGFALLAPPQLVMEAHSRIGHFTVARGVDLIHLEEHAIIGRLNWITAIPASSQVHLTHMAGRAASLRMEEHSAVTHRHLIECSAAVRIGRFATVGGYRSQLMSRWLDVDESRQTAAPITIGAFSLVTTNCILLGGSVFPPRSVLAAMSLLNKRFDDEGCLYGGVPATRLKSLPPDALYFGRPSGPVV